MNPRKPDYDLCIVTPVPGRRNGIYTKVGSGWLNPDGKINMHMVTMPGVRIILCPKEDNEHK